MESLAVRFTHNLTLTIAFFSLVCFPPQYGGPMQGMPHQGMPGAHMGGPMPGNMGGQLGGAPAPGGYAPYGGGGGGYSGGFGAPAPAANDPMWGYFTAIAGQVTVSFC